MTGLKMSVEVSTLGDLRRAVDLLESRGVDVEADGFTFSRRHGGSLVVIEPLTADEGEGEGDGGDGEEPSDTPF